MGNNNPNTKIIIKREIAGYDSNGNPIYREVRVPVQTHKPQTTVRRTPPTTNANRRKRPVKKTKKSRVKKIVNIAILLAVIALAVCLAVYFFVNYIGFSDSAEEAIGVSQNDIIYTFKVDDDHRITVYASDSKLCADLMLVNGDKYKSIKSCSSIDLNTYETDLAGKKMKFTESGDICFALDFAGSDQYDSFKEYIDENSSKSFNPGAISVDENSKQIFVLWYWIE